MKIFIYLLFTLPVFAVESNYIGKVTSFKNNNYTITNINNKLDASDSMVKLIIVEDKKIIIKDCTFSNFTATRIDIVGDGCNVKEALIFTGISQKVQITVEPDDSSVNLTMYGKTYKLKGEQTIDLPVDLKVDYYITNEDPRYNPKKGSFIVKEMKEEQHINIILKNEAKSNELIEKHEKAKSRSWWFPGLGQMDINPDNTKSKIVYNSGLAFFWLTFVSVINFQLEQGEYRNNVAYTSGSNTRRYAQYTTLLKDTDRVNALNLLLMIDAKKFQSKREEVTTAANYVNSSAGLFVIVYLYSVIDIYFFSNSVCIRNFNSLPIAKLEKGELDFTVMRNPIGTTSIFFNGSNAEDKYILQYSYKF